MPYDVVIIGAGPAGLAAAQHLLVNTDMSILLIDKNPVDYNKPCGGGVPTECFKEFPFLSTIKKHTTREMIACYKEYQQRFDIEINMIPRDAMRHTMMQNLFSFSNDRLDTLVHAAVTEIDFNDKRVVINNKLTCHYEWLIGADGVNSIVAKTAGFKYKKATLVVTENTSDEMAQRAPDARIIFIDELPMGYLWVFPKGDHVNIGMGGNVGGKELQKEFQRQFRSLPCSTYRTTHRTAHMIPMEYQYGHLRLHDINKYNVILCGDAATFINSMTGEGIYYALKGGKEAAEVVMGTRPTDDYPSFHPYLSRVQQLQDEIKDLPVRESFEKIFVDRETSLQTVTFLFSHHIPKPKIYSAKEKNKIYETL